MIIYKITNKLDEKVYIGQTVQTMESRLKAHYKNPKNTYIKNALLKYGLDNFEIEQIDSAISMDELNNKEEFWIAFYDACNRDKGYNRTHGGKNARRSEQTRKQMSESRKGKKVDREVVERQRQKLIGVKHSPERKANISKSLMGKKRGPMPDEVKEKIRLAHTGKKRTPEQNERNRQARLGKKRSLETRQKISKARTGTKRKKIAIID